MAYEEIHRHLRNSLERQEELTAPFINRWRRPPSANWAGLPLRSSRSPYHAATQHEAERLIESCEGCNPEDAEIPFDNILNRITGSVPSLTDYILEASAKCPNCRQDVLEKSLVEHA